MSFTSLSNSGSLGGDEGSVLMRDETGIDIGDGSNRSDNRGNNGSDRSFKRSSESSQMLGLGLGNGRFVNGNNGSIRVSDERSISEGVRVGVGVSEGVSITESVVGISSGVEVVVKAVRVVSGGYGAVVVRSILGIGTRHSSENNLNTALFHINH